MMMYEREDINEILLNNARAMLHRNEKNNGGENRKLEKEKERIKKDRTTDAPVVVVVPRGIFPFPFQRRALLRSRDPHNNVLVLVVIIVVLLLLFYIIMWSVVSSITNKTD